MHQGARHAGRRAREHRHDRAAAHLADVHDAAIAAHDHQRRLNPGFANAGLGHDGGIDHFRQDAGVDHGRACPGRETIELGDLVTAGGSKPGLDDQPAHGLFGIVVVDAKGGTCDDDLGAFRLEFADRLPDGLVGQRLLRKEPVCGLQVAAGSKFDRLHRALALGKERLHTGRHADHADACHVALEQRVGGLGRRMREKDDFLGVYTGLLEHVAEYFHDALCNPARVGVSGQHGKPADHLMGRVVDKHSLGEGTADIDPDAIGAGRHG